MFKLSISIALALLIAAGTFHQASMADDTASPAFEMSSSDLFAIQSLIIARGALTGIAEGSEGIQRDVHFRDAITSLTALYQLAGCQWAENALLDVLSEQDAPKLRAGYSRDGRILAMVEPLDLKNEAFADYTIFLVSLDSNSGQILEGQLDSTLTCELTNGQTVKAHGLDETHPLWEKLSRSAHTFKPAGSLYPLSGFTFKQVYLASEIPFGSISSVSLLWGQYKLVVPYYSTEVRPGG